MGIILVLYLDVVFKLLYSIFLTNKLLRVLSCLFIEPESFKNHKNDFPIGK